MICLWCSDIDLSHGWCRDIDGDIDVDVDGHVFLLDVGSRE